MTRSFLSVGFVIAILAGCTTFPDVPATPRTRAEAPRFLNYDELQTQTNPGQVPDLPDISSRLARLRAKANRLRSPVLNRRDRARLRPAI